MGNLRLPDNQFNCKVLIVMYQGFDDLQKERKNLQTVPLWYASHFDEGVVWSKSSPYSCLWIGVHSAYLLDLFYPPWSQLAGCHARCHWAVLPVDVACVPHKWKSQEFVNLWLLRSHQNVATATTLSTGIRFSLKKVHDKVLEQNFSFSEIPQTFLGNSNLNDTSVTHFFWRKWQADRPVKKLI